MVEQDAHNVQVVGSIPTSRTKNVLGITPTLNQGYGMNLSLTKHSDRTLKDLAQILSDNDIDYYVKEKNGCVVKIHFIVREETSNE